MTSKGDAERRDHPIYHLVPELELRDCVRRGVYTPAGLARDGFVHCSLEASVLPVADDYYADVSGPLLLLEIDPRKLTAETRYEAPAPIAGGGTAHLEGAPIFPHVYGPIETHAILRVGTLGRGKDGRYAWPEAFAPIEALLASEAS